MQISQGFYKQAMFASSSELCAFISEVDVLWTPEIPILSHKGRLFHGSGSCASCVGAQDFRDPSWGGVESLERRGISLLRRMRALDDSGGIASVFVRLVLRQSRVCCVHVTRARLARQWASARPCQSRRVATHPVRFTGQCNADSARFG